MFKQAVLTKSEIISFLRANKAILHEQFRVNEIGLFGSFARDEANEKSDIDFLVVIDDDVVNYREIKSALKTFLVKHFGREVDLANPQSLKPHFKNRILSQAVYA